MDKYIEQLIDDMREAAKNLPPVPDFDLPEEMEFLQGVMEWEEADYKPMQEWFGLEKKHFPPSDSLNDVQIKLMVSEILNLWQAFNFYPTLPDNLPDRLTYDILVKYLEEPVQWISEGMSGIEFCDYETDECPFPEEYCMCKDIEHDINLLNDVGNYCELNQLKKEIKFLDKKHRKGNFFSVLSSRKVYQGE